MQSKFLLPVLFFALGAFALAQVDRATVTGTLRDPSGAVLAQAKITVSYPATGLSRTAVSNESGAYFIAGLPVGSTVIEAQKTGFRAVRTETDLGVGETKTLDFVFEIASVDTSVQVIAEADLVRNSAAVGATLGNTQISRLPINGRNWQNLMTLVPGAVDTGNGSSARFLGHVADEQLPC
jgi:hypothetical protein